jgi:hypothetical protein
MPAGTDMDALGHINPFTTRIVLMNSHTDGTSKLADVRSLLHFRIYKTTQGGQHEQIALFRNGRQQCPIKVAIIAADIDGEVVDLTEDEVYGALNLIRYDDGATIGADYTVARLKNDFEWDEKVISASGRILREPAQDHDQRASRPAAEVTPQAAPTYTLYVSAVPKAEDVDIAASLAIPDYMTFVTNSDADDEDGNGDEGQFNSSVELLLSDSPYLTPADFGAAANGILAGTKVGEWNTNFFWANEYYINPKFNGRTLKLHSVGAQVSETENSDGTKVCSANGDFGLYAYGDFFGTVKWGISYFGTPGSTTPSGQSVNDLDRIELGSRRSATRERARSLDIKTHVSADDYVQSVTTTVHLGQNASASGTGATPLITYTPETMFNTCCGSIRGAKANRVVIGLLKGNLSATFSNSSGGEIAEVTSTTFHILDAYGNDHSLSLLYDALADELSIA